MEFTIDDRFSILTDMVRASISAIIRKVDHYDSIAKRTGKSFPTAAESIRQEFEKVSTFIDSMDEGEKMALLGSWDIEGDAEFIENWLSNH